MNDRTLHRRVLGAMLFRLSVFVFALLPIAPASRAAVIYVRGNYCCPPETGASWTSPFRTVQAGLNAARAGDEVWVAAATYKESITLKAGVAVYGGFIGNETTRAQRDIRANVTTLDGNSASAAVRVSNAGSTTVLDGFVIRNGIGTYYGGLRVGGGVACSNSSPMLRNLLVTGNTAQRGAGIFAVNGQPVLEDVTISGNIASERGGGVAAVTAQMSLSNVTIWDNRAAAGGAVAALTGATVTVRNSVLTGNVATIEGGAVYGEGATLTLAGSTIAANASPVGSLVSSGGALTLRNSIVAFNAGAVTARTEPTVVMDHNCFFDNGSSPFSGVSDPTGSSGNIAADPLLYRPDLGDVHLLVGSPCRDAGDSAFVTPGEKDLDGRARVLGASVDIGADESNPAVIRVRPDGDDTKPGDSWANAKRTPAAAITAASANGGEVWIAEGVYTVRLQLPAGVSLLGGFDGTESASDARNPAAHPTVLQGDGKSGGVIVVGVGATPFTRIDGFTIRNGVGTVPPRLSTPCGGGIQCISTSPTISRNIITGNYAGSGGALYLQDSAAVVTGNNIVNNRAGSGGGGVTIGYSNVRMISNVLRGNSAVDAGGLYLYGVSALGEPSVVANNTFLSNGASKQGGAAYITDGRADLVNNIIANNSSGVYATTSTGGTNTLNFRNNIVFDNGAYDLPALAPPSVLENNRTVDPGFVLDASGIPHIVPDSPARNAGRNDAVLPGETDIDGQARLQGATVDIGADESDGTQPSPSRRVVRVSTTGADTADGASWATAKRTVAAGIAALAPTGGEVWVAAGTYPERLQLPADVALYGGFAGTETARDQRNWAANVTVIDGASLGPVVSVNIGASRGTVIDGFTIRNGKSTSGSPGSGVPARFASPTVRNNRFYNNTSTAVLAEGSSPAIVNNTFHRNAGYEGAALALKSTTAATRVTNNTFAGNGDIAVIATQALGLFANNIVAYNTEGLTIRPANPTASLTLKNNLFYGNVTQDVSGIADPVGTTGNLRADPRLAAVPQGDLHIQPDSPARDAGDNASADSAHDFDAQPRIQGARVDIGADESDGTVQTVVVPAIRVRPGGDDTADGATWATAKATLQAAINAAAAVNGEVWAAAGMYDTNITLKSPVTVYGGFAGTETDRVERNPALYETVVDGGYRATVVTVAEGSLFCGLDGLTVRGGKANYFNNGYAGGGFAARNAITTLANCTFTGNMAARSGGAVYVFGGGIALSGNRFVANWASEAGGAVCAVIAGVNASNNVFLSNDAGLEGGGFFAGGSFSVPAGRAVLRNNTFHENRSPVGGAVSLRDAGHVLSNNIITANTSGVAAESASPPAARHNLFFDNPDGNATGWPDPVGANGNIAADPLLADPDADDLHIQPASPARNAGDTAAVPAGESDIDGDPRVFDGAVDIGADESDGRVWTPQRIVIHVTPSGDDANDGASWSTARKTVQSAINALPPSGGEVWVTAGTYNERIALRSRARVYGDFAGTESAREARNYAANATILDAGLAGSVVTAGPGVVRAVLDGFTVRNGRAENGAGVYARFAYLEVSHSRLLSNATGTTGGQQGGGLYAESASVLLSQSLLWGNKATSRGGGIALVISTLTAVNNTLMGNTASEPISTYSWGGGGLAMDMDSGATLVNNNVVQNVGGGIYPHTYSALTMRHNNVFGNGANYVDTTDRTGQNGNLMVDPVLLDNVHLRADSPLVDAGAPYLRAAAYDFDAEPRPRGLTFDIGADETAGPRVTPNLPIVYVRPDGSDTNTGASWLNAKRTLTAAQNAAKSPGGEVWVAAGTYRERVILREGVSLFGGFAGNETSRDSRTALTVLDGGGTGTILVAGPAITRATVVDGFTLKNGTGTGPTSYPTWGGAVYSEGSPTLRRNVFTGNAALTGGAVYLAPGTSALLQANTFTGNTSPYSGYGNGGGGGAVLAENASPHIEGNVFDGNSSRGNGGAILGTGGAPVVVNNTFTGNGAVYGGGVYLSGGAITLTGNLFDRNSAGYYAGGALVNGAGALVANNVVRLNKAERTGGMDVTGNGATVRGNVFFANTSQTAGFGSAMSLAGTDLVADNNTVAGHTAGTSAAVTASSGVILANNVVAFNSAGIGKNAYAGTSTVVFSHNAFWQNRDYDVSGFTNPVGANGNIKADPLFASLPSGDLHIQPGSPLRDAGNDAFAPSGAKDMDGQPRIQGAHVDIGADESDGTAWPGLTRVIRVRPNGSDTGDGSDWDTALRTLQAAADALAAHGGGEIWAAAGMYPQGVSLQGFVSLYGGFAGTETDRGQRDPRRNITEIAPPIPSDSLARKPAVEILGGAASVVVDGLTVRNEGVKVDSYADAVIRNSVIRDNEIGIKCDTYATVVIDGNEITRNTFGGIECRSTQDVTVTNNRIVGNSGGMNASGLDFYDTSGTVANNVFAANMSRSGAVLACNSNKPVLIANNTFVDNESAAPSDTWTVYSGAISAYSSNNKIVNNIIAYNSGGIETGTGANVAYVSHNCVYGNTRYNYRGGPATGADISADPMLVNRAAGDFHIQPDSPCRDTGGSTFTLAGWRDMDGQPRILGARVDIGADESDGTAWSAVSRVVRVSASGDDANDGSSWLRAKRSIQAAMDSLTPVGGEVWVTAGTFSEQLVIGPFVSLYGGFDGTEVTRAGRASGARTVLDAGRKGLAVSVRSGRSEATLDRFTVQGGYASTTEYVGGVPSGIHVVGSSITLLDSVVTGNTGSNSMAIRSEQGRLTIRDSRVYGNTGGIRCQGTALQMKGSTVEGGTFQGISVQNAGGSTILTANTIVDGAISATGEADIQRNHLKGATTWTGIHLGSSDYYNPTYATVANNLIEHRSSTSGGIRCDMRVVGLVASNTLIGVRTGNGYNAGISTDSNQVRIANNIIVGYDTGLSGQVDQARYNNIYNVTVTSAGNTQVPNLIGVNGNISADPKFVNAAAGDFHLAAGSPCIDAGDDAAVEVNWRDMDGGARRAGARVDIGADEAGSRATTMADLVQALRIAGGLAAADASALSALSGVSGLSTPITLPTATSMARNTP